MRKLSYNERNWLAGFIDGEGHIGFTSRSALKRSTRIAPRVIIVNTYKPIMQYLADLLETRLWKRKRYNLKWKQVYAVELRSHKAFKLLRIVLPYLRVKKEQAKLCLTLYSGYVRHWRPSGRFRKLDIRTSQKRINVSKKVMALNRGKNYEKTIS